jgi:3-dehydroquinate synthase
MKPPRALSSQVATVEPRVITIRAGNATYEAHVGGGLLTRVGEYAAKIFHARRCAIISDQNVMPRFGPRVMLSLKEFAPTLITVPAGERSKSLEQIGRLCEKMEMVDLGSTSFIVALGGGVVGDLVGFAAAIYHRGIPYIQVPTTLLAQVDSAIGGKTGVNTRDGKNLLGAIHQPALVVADIDTLQTLPERELNQGFAEIIKHAIIADPSLFESLSQPDLAALIARNIEIKAGIVARDERDATGERAILNFGHTVGHAIERVAGYGTLLHGEAISLGIVAACEVSIQRAGFSAEERATVVRFLEKFGLPTKLPPSVSRDAILRAMYSDKKFEHGEVRFVVTPRLGSAYLTSDVTLEDIRRAIANL